MNDAVRKPMLGEHSLVAGERWYVWSKCAYVIRDHFNGEGKFVRCEYGTRMLDGGIAWKPCEEGVEFADIEPFAANVQVNA